MKIFLAAGHGGKDPGAVFGKKTERDTAVSIVENVKAWLKPYTDIVVVPHQLGLLDEIKWINARSSGLKDIAIEVHLNAGGGKGTETYFYAGSNTSKKFAQVIQSRLVGKIKTVDRGVKADNTTRFKRLGFIRDTKPLAILVEAFFIQESIKTTDAGRGIANGIVAYLGLKLKTKKLVLEVPVNFVNKILAYVKLLLSKK